MFEFKKAMKGVSKQDEFECECCGSMEGQDSTESSGCKSGCDSANTSCCGSAKSSCGAPMESFCGENASEKPKPATKSGCKSSCSGE